MIELIINEQLYCFEEVDLTQFDKPLDITIATENLLLFKQVMDHNRVFFSLAFGTLLGAYRDNSFIPHDTDIDVLITNEQDLIRAIPELHQVGLSLVRIADKDATYSFLRNGVYIDAYIVDKKPITWFLSWYYASFCGGVIPRHILKRHVAYIFLNAEFMIPQKTEGFLQYYYGKNWRVPYKGHLNHIFPSVIMLAKKIAQAIMPRKWRAYILKSLKLE